ncbi:YmdB family metallophosphoesterase [Patescibacteria group bacterium]|nr:YmdB family metallophosphoesterase [Patescibacteria group bacterium]
MTKQITICVFGDIVGKIGRKALTKQLPIIKNKFKPDLTIANVENLAHGRGITEKSLLEISDAGIEAFTSGHHVWENKMGAPLLNSPKWSARLIRPMNVDPKLPGKGWVKLSIKNQNIYLLNLQGQLYMPQNGSSPFLTFDRFWQEQQPNPDKDILIIDLHAETTSEKMAFANYVDGKATLVFGTHTHVPTADPKILPGGTANITDVGMVGSYDSVIGFEKNSSIKRFLNITAAPYKLQEKGLTEINGLIITVNLDSHKVTVLKQIREIVDI